MLEKNEKKLIFDAHFHFYNCKKLGIFEFPADFTDTWAGISCAHSKEEWEFQKTAPSSVIQAYGLHPQNASIENVAESTDFLELLIRNKQISAIGEAGFDFFTDEYKSFRKKQEEIWNIQLELAVKNNLPLIIHCRKANEKLFEYSKTLSKLPEVLFHSFMGTAEEGESLLKRGINGYFSFGKQVFNNNKKVINCVKKLPENRVLGETDAPFQCLKGEEYTKPCEIKKILEEIEKLRKEI